MQPEYLAKVMRRIQTSKVRTRPFHHAVVDGLLDRDTLQAMHDKWPSQELFDPEYTGKGTMPLFQETFKNMPSEDAAFWADIGKSLTPAIIDACLQRFAPVLRHVHGDLIDHPEWGALPTLMHSNTDFDGQNCHSHFFHNPNWTMTALLYLGDTDGRSSEGTALWEPRGDTRDIEWLTDLAMDTLRWDHRKDIAIARKVKFKPNRLLVFLDGPLAFHSVLPGETGADQTRRILRVHMGIDFDRYRQERIPFVEDQKSFLRMFMPPYHMRPHIMENLSAEDLRRREGPGREFVTGEIHARASAPVAGKQAVAPPPPYDV